MSVQIPNPAQIFGEPLAWVIRGNVVESAHSGHLVALDAGGEIVERVGAIEVDMFARSSLKPLQALVMLDLGVSLAPEQIALACASHNAEPEHIEVVTGMLQDAGLTAADLQNTPSLPLANPRSTAEPASITQNCSGKHAAMLATCVHKGWPTDTYLDPDHPLQRAIRQGLAELTGTPVTHATIDGCGAPLFSTSLLGLARAFAALAQAPTGSNAAAVVHSMSTHPDLVGGTGRDVTGAMRDVPGLIAKDGAEGVYAGALPSGAAFAFKIADGAARPRPVVLAAVLAQLGAAPAPGTQWDWGSVSVLGHGEPVGSVQAAFGDAPMSTRPAGAPAQD